MKNNHLHLLAFAAVVLLAACKPSSPDSATKTTLNPVYADKNASVDQRRRILDQAVLDALVRAGTNLNLPHRIEHHFSSRDAKDLELLAARGKASGFVPGEITQVGEKFQMDLVKEMKPTIEQLSIDSTLMSKLAVEFKCQYDDWGCEVNN